MGGILKPVVSLLTGGLIGGPKIPNAAKTVTPPPAFSDNSSADPNAAQKEEGENEALTRARKTREALANRTTRNDLRVDLSGSTQIAGSDTGEDTPRPTRSGITL